MSDFSAGLIYFGFYIDLKKGNFAEIGTNLRLLSTISKGLNSQRVEPLWRVFKKEKKACIKLFLGVRGLNVRVKKRKWPCKFIYPGEAAGAEIQSFNVTNFNSWRK